MNLSTRLLSLSSTFPPYSSSPSFSPPCSLSTCSSYSSPSLPSRSLSISSSFTDDSQPPTLPYSPAFGFPLSIFSSCGTPKKIFSACWLWIRHRWFCPWKFTNFSTLVSSFQWDSTPSTRFRLEWYTKEVRQVSFPLHESNRWRTLSFFSISLLLLTANLSFSSCDFSLLRQQIQGLPPEPLSLVSPSTPVQMSSQKVVLPPQLSFSSLLSYSTSGYTSISLEEALRDLFFRLHFCWWKTIWFFRHFIWLWDEDWRALADGRIIIVRLGMWRDGIEFGWQWCCRWGRGWGSRTRFWRRSFWKGFGRIGFWKWCFWWGCWWFQSDGDIFFRRGRNFCGIIGVLCFLSF